MNTESLESMHFKDEPASTSKVFDIGPYGKLHEVTLTGEHFEGLRKHCLNTACAYSYPVVPGAHFPTEVHNLLEQTGLGHGRSMLTKLVNGYVVHTPNGIVRSLIYDHHLCQPHSLHESNVEQPTREGKVKIFSVVAPPGKNVQHFYLSQDHDGVLDHNMITNFMPAERVVSKIKSAMSLEEGVPRVIYSSPNFCTLKGYNLLGKDANEVKSTFLKLLSVTQGGTNMYDSTLKLPKEVSKKLLLKNDKGMVCIAPLKNGIMGFRKRDCDDGQSLIFMCSSDDFHNEKPSLSDDSAMQVYKLDYKSQASDANRIFVNTNPCAPKVPRCPFNTPPITTNMTVQEALNHVEYSLRKALMEHLGCHEYADYVRRQRGTGKSYTDMSSSLECMRGG